MTVHRVRAEFRQPTFEEGPVVLVDADTGAVLAELDAVDAHVLALELRTVVLQAKLVRPRGQARMPYPEDGEL